MKKLLIITLVILITIPLIACNGDSINDEVHTVKAPELTQKPPPEPTPDPTPEPKPYNGGNEQTLAQDVVGYYFFVSISTHTVTGNTREMTTYIRFFEDGTILLVPALISSFDVAKGWLEVGGASEFFDGVADDGEEIWSNLIFGEYTIEGDVIVGSWRSSTLGITTFTATMNDDRSLSLPRTTSEGEEFIRIFERIE